MNDSELAKRKRVARSGTPWVMWLLLLFLVAVVVGAVFAPQLSPRSPYTMVLSERYLPPGSFGADGTMYRLGSDELGRDMLSRLLFGARTSLIVAVVSLTLGAGIGLAVGLIAGYVGGKVDAVLSRLIDSALAFPAILIALLLAMALGPGLETMFIAIGSILWARFARVMRGEVLSLKESAFIAQAKVNGCSTLRIVVLYLIPNVLNTFVVLLTLQSGFVILIEASLSFLGMGVPPPAPSWGQMIASGRDVLAFYWWIPLIPGIAIALLVLSLNLLGDWLRDLLDPKLREI